MVMFFFRIRFNVIIRYIEFSILTNTKIFFLECVYENRFKIKYCIFLPMLTLPTSQIAVKKKN